MLLKGVAEVETAPDRRAAAEMILIRLCHVSDQPPPAELIKKLTEQGTQNANGFAPGPSGGGGARAVANGGAVTAAAPRAITFNDVVALAGQKRDVMLYAHLRQSVHLVRFAPPVIELRLEPDAPRDLSQRLAALLEAETGRRWTIAIVHAPGEPSIAEVERAEAATMRQSAEDHPLVQAILKMFPGAKIQASQDMQPADDEPPADWAALAPPDEAYSDEEEE
jgi:DNA polymerase-3 subunit gamma/tau